VHKPTHNRDTVNKYVDENVGGGRLNKVSKSGDTMSGDLNMDVNRITGLPTSLPASSSDAASWLQIVSLVKAAEIDNALKVSETGDLMVGDLKLSIDDDNTRKLGCTDLAIGKYFSVLLGDTLNRLHFAFEISYNHGNDTGFLIKVRDGDVCQIGTRNNPPEISYSFSEILGSYSIE